MHDESVSEKDADRDRMLARDQMLLYGSDDVINAYDEWVRYADMEKHDLDREGELISLIFLAIRKDLLLTFCAQIARNIVSLSAEVCIDSKSVQTKYTDVPKHVHQE